MNKDEVNIYFNSIDKTYDEIILEHKQLSQENQQLKEQLKSVETLTCFNLPDNINLITLMKPDYERNLKEYETLDKYKTIKKELRTWLEAIKTMYENEYKDVNAAEHYNSVLSKLNELEEEN